MKLWRLLCFLFLAVLSVSRGQSPSNESSRTHESKDDPTPTPSPPPLMSPTRAVNTTTAAAAAAGWTPTPPQTPTTASVSPSTNTSSTENTTASEEPSTKGSSRGGEATTSGHGGAPGGRDEAEGDGGIAVSTATPGTSAKPVKESQSSSSWGFVILALIFLLIVVLCIVLYFLRRVSRSYSFDLHRQDPIINQFNEPTGTGFEPVYLDDLDQPAPKDQVTAADLSPPPVTNGTSLQLEERASNGETDLQDQPEVNGVETSAGPSSPAEGGEASPPGSTDLLFDDPGKNENNNNPSVLSSDPFVDINLDEPAWCDRLLTSADVPSSVLPFSPFSFSSSSSISSS